MDNSVTITDPEVWVEKYADVLYRFALGRVRNNRLAEDLVQETFLAALQSMENFAGRSSVQTWLITILKHKIVDYYRKTFRERNLDPEKNQDWMDNEDSHFYTRSGHWKNGPHKWNVDPQAMVERKDFREVLRTCLDKLPRRLSTVFIFREIDGMSTEEICNALGITSTNLWVMLHRARSRLRACLEENWFKTLNIKESKPK